MSKEKRDFKVDDWIVSSTNGLGRVNKDENGKFFIIYPDGSGEYLKDIKYEKWQPKEGEWCWFWGDGMRMPIIDRFIQKTEYADYTAETGINLNRYSIYKDFKNCEPFIGELPTVLKSSNE